MDGQLRSIRTAVTDAPLWAKVISLLAVLLVVTVGAVNVSQVSTPRREVGEPVRTTSPAGSTTTPTMPPTTGASVSTTSPGPTGAPLPTQPTTPSVPTAPLRTVSPTDAAAQARVQPGATRMMIVGNSVAAFLSSEGFANLTVAPTFVMLDLTRPMCVFPTSSKVRIPSEPDGVQFPDCRTGWAGAVAMYDPEVVIVAYNDVGTFAFWHDNAWVQPCSAEFAQMYRDALDEQVATLGATGARVVLTTSAYQLSVYDSPEVRLGAECANSLLRDYGNSRSGIRVVDLARLVCPRFDFCRDQIDGVVLRPDGVHYRGEGAKFIARWLLDQSRS